MSQPHSAPAPVRFAEKLAQFDAQWTPHRVAKFDGHQLVLAKVQGEFVWHDHKDHDEVFLPITGTLFLDFEGGVTRELGPGELLVVPAGVSHRPRTHPGEEVHILVIDPMEVQHTGDVESDKTVAEYPEI